jgi:hypothetical protein
MPSAALDKTLQTADVMILPIDGTQHILTYSEVGAILDKYRPKAVIRGHYLVRGAASILSGLKPADDWVNLQKDVRRIEGGEIEFSTDDLRDAQQRVYYFGSGYTTDNHLIGAPRSMKMALLLRGSAMIP